MAERLAQTPGNVIYAGARSPDSAALLKEAADKAEGRIRLIQLDTADDASVKVSVSLSVLGNADTSGCHSNHRRQGGRS